MFRVLAFLQYDNQLHAQWWLQAMLGEWSPAVLCCAPDNNLRVCVISPCRTFLQIMCWWTRRTGETWR